MIIVIDGPAGSGKSSTARAVANRLSIQYLDSGALYRALTLLYLKNGKDESAFFELLDQTEISFFYKEGVFRLFIDGDEITDRIRDVDVNDHVSEVAAMPSAREHVNALMRNVVQNDVYIAEGRDLGTAVFPEADLKFFMMADIETRAQRRHEELRKRGEEVSLSQVKRNIEQRDRKDSQRKADPLKKPDDAIEIDTTDMSFEQQVQFICSKVTNEMKNRNVN